MVQGKLPFTGNSNSEITDKIINQEFKFTKAQESELSKEIRDLLLKLFTKEFKLRITMNDILDHEWTVGTKFKEEEKLEKASEETKTKKATKANLQKRYSDLDKISPNSRIKNQLKPKMSANYGKNIKLVQQKKK